MNFYDNIPNFNGHNPNNLIPIQGNPMLNNNISYKINELEQRIKKLELRISQLETNKDNSNYLEPDNTMYMI